VRDTDNLGPEASGETSEGIWPYLGVGCLTAVSGAVASGMIAVLLAKMVGWATKCAPDAETGAPCGWFDYAKFGMVIGVIVFPSVALWLLWRSRHKRRNNV
jgi:hypothetical protein